MKFFKTKILPFLVLHLICTMTYAQNVTSDYLKGLTKVPEAILQTKQIALDGESIAVYNVDGKRIRGIEMMEAFTSGEYTPEFYMDNNQTIKAVTLRLASTEEKLSMKVAQSELQGELRNEGPASTFTATDLNGTSYTLENLKGKIIVMNFWFIECKPCLLEMADLNTLVEKHKKEDVVFLGFALNDSRKLEAFLEKTDFIYNVIPNSNPIAQDYGVSGYPTHIVIDQNSEIVYSASGLSPVTVPNLEKAIENLLK